MDHRRPAGALAVADTDDPACAVALRGRLDAWSLPAARSHLRHAVDEAEGEEVVVDVAGLEIWDAGALGVLAGTQHRASRDGRQLVLTGGSPRLCRMLRAAKLHRLVVLRDAQPVPGQRA